jgi:hypothetical protein
MEVWRFGGLDVRNDLRKPHVRIPHFQISAHSYFHTSIPPPAAVV